ncbi:MAG: phenylalanine--tRNA ligase subunit beta [Hydrogenophilus sp.]|nr:phenylalanine--tRNA ligase subunit beta [Hydrogenophilus sp.]
MRVLWSWLTEWVPEVGRGFSAKEIAERLTMAGVEVEEVEEAEPLFSGVVVGEVVRIEPHPCSERLRVYEVTSGEGKRVRVVGEGDRVEVGWRVPLARVGALLPDGTAVREHEREGVRSEGLLCSAYMLGVGEREEGVMRLLKGEVGEAVHRLLGLEDWVLELKLTPNRADCLSVLGVAREVAALLRVPLVAPWGGSGDGRRRFSPTIPEVPACEEVAVGRTVRLREPTACPRYLGRMIEGIAPRMSTPAWMRRRLQAAGVRLVHFVVDVTNYVMLELGQPLHAFDATTLRGDLQVRWAKTGESLRLLTGEEAQLEERTLVIADEEGPVAIAGVMGGADSGVREETSTVFLESAFFAPEAVAGRARRYGLHSEAAHRFERGVDPEGCQRALERATALIVAQAGGRASRVIQAEVKEALPQRKAVVADVKWMAACLGTEVSAEEGAELLAREGFEVQVEGEQLRVTPPSWRFDVTIAEDLVEEVARLRGYDRVPAQLPAIRVSLRAEQPEERSYQAVRSALRQRGYHEGVTFAFVSEEWERVWLGNRAPVRLANPIAAHLAVMRSSLLPGLAAAIAENARHQVRSVRLFEIGRVFWGAEPITEVRREELAAALERLQPWRVAAGAWGRVEEEGWGPEGQRTIDFYDVKGDLEALFTPFPLEFTPLSDHPFFHPGRAAIVRWTKGEERSIGVIGELHPQWARALELSPPPIFFEVSLRAALRRERPLFRPFSRQPSVERDVAVVVPKEVAAGELVAEARRAGGTLLVGAWVFDCYQGRGIPEGMKSVALRLRWQGERSLTDEEVTAGVDRVVAALGESFGARLRG